MNKRVFFDESAFHRFWNEPIPSRHVLSHLLFQNRQLRRLVSESANFLGGALLSDEFALFQNGGIPLLERRTGPLIEEILVRPRLAATRGSEIVVRVTVHLSHIGLQETRRQYWSPPSRAPSLIAGLDIGALEFPPRWIAWNLDEANDTKIELVDWVRNLVLPWFDVFSQTRELRGKLFRGEISHIGLDTSLELVITEYGVEEGARFLNECILSDSNIGPLVREQAKRIMRAQDPDHRLSAPVSNLAAIAACYRLIRR
ncbi:MAG: hypothetical protein P4L46_25665 [Fimbriimonas sp.]|nr:hypothetical protein [Fimbriimonas sp.]